MSKSISFVLAIGLLGLVASCSQPEPEPVFVEPVMAEPVFTGKY